MKLQELAAPSPTKQIAKVFESYFGSNIEFDRLTQRQTQHLLQRVQGLLREHRSGSARYQSQQNVKSLHRRTCHSRLITSVRNFNHCSEYRSETDHKPRERYLSRLKAGN